MACVGSSRLCWPTLLALVLCVFAQGNNWECLDKDELISEMPTAVDLPSDCMLTCTAITYKQIVDRQQKVTVRFKDSRPGKADDFCWFIQSRCSTWDEVFVLLSLSEAVAAEEMIRLQTDSLIHTEPIEPHGSPSILPDECGLRFDVTPHLRAPRQNTLCVRPNGIMGNRLQCPPSLVFIRQKQSKSPTHS